jgi:hypothetical protein
MTGKIICESLGMLPCCALLSLCVTFAGYHVSRFIQSGQGRRKELALYLLLSLYFVPSLAVGYFWADVSYSLLRHTLLNLCLYSFLMAVKLLPVSVMVFHFLPRTISAQGSFCMRLSGTGAARGLRLLLFLARSSGKPFAASALLTFLFAFSEFDLASLLGVKHWTVALFDLNSGGMPVSDLLRMMAFPVSLEMLLVLGFAVCYRDGGWLRQSEASELEVKAGRAAKLQSGVIVAAGLLALVVCPLLALLRKGVGGIPDALGDEGLMREAGTGFLFALLSSLAAFYASGVFLRRLAHAEMGVGRFAVFAALLLPGLMGALPLGLVMLYLFQLPCLVELRDTPAPLLLALFLFQLPFAIFLRYALGRVAPDESLFLAEGMLGASSSKAAAARILWRLKHLVKCCLLLVIFMPAYFDVTLSAILAPVTMPTLFTRLYNLLHYGHCDKLSATLLVAVALPGLFFLALLALSRLAVPMMGLAEASRSAKT